MKETEQDKEKGADTLTLTNTPTNERKARVVSYGVKTDSGAAGD